MAPSKTFNIPGLGCAFAVIPDAALRRRFERAMHGIVPHVNVLGLAACEAAYRDCGDWRRELLAYLRGNRDRVAKADGRRLPGATHEPCRSDLPGVDRRRANSAGRSGAHFEAHGSAFPAAPISARRAGCGSISAARSRPGRAAPVAERNVRSVTRRH
jgi:cystathionine beta-lyase